jgi:hypothetical protein
MRNEKLQSSHRKAGYRVQIAIDHHAVQAVAQQPVVPFRFRQPVEIGRHAGELQCGRVHVGADSLSWVMKLGTALRKSRMVCAVSPAVTFDAATSPSNCGCRSVTVRSASCSVPWAASSTGCRSPRASSTVSQRRIGPRQRIAHAPVRRLADLARFRHHIFAQRRHLPLAAHQRVFPRRPNLVHQRRARGNYFAPAERTPWPSRCAPARWCRPPVPSTPPTKRKRISAK